MIGLIWWFSTLPTAEDKEHQRQAADLSVLAASATTCSRASPPKVPTQTQAISGAKAGGKFVTQDEVEQFDILGVRLYTPIREALAAAKLSGLKNGPNLSFTSCAADSIERDKLMRAHPARYSQAKTSCIKASSLWDDNKVGMQIEFVEDLPLQPGCMVVSHIRLDQGGRENAASIEAWKHALEAKYGRQSNWGHYPYAELQAHDYYYTFTLELHDKAFAEDRTKVLSKLIADAKPVASPTF